MQKFHISGKTGECVVRLIPEIGIEYEIKRLGRQIVCEIGQEGVREKMEIKLDISVHVWLQFTDKPP